MSDETRYVRKDVLDTTVDEDLILFDQDAGKYYATSEVGAVIWAHLSSPVTFAELCDRLEAEYEVSRQECEHETRSFLQELLNVGLVIFKSG